MDDFYQRTSKVCNNNDHGKKEDILFCHPTSYAYQNSSLQFEAINRLQRSDFSNWIFQTTNAH